MLLTERHSGFTCGFKFPHGNHCPNQHCGLFHTSQLLVMWGYEADVVPQSLHTALPSPIEAAECGLSTFFFFFFQELVAEARHRVLYSTVCFCIIESGDCLQPSNRTQLRGNMQIWWINISQWSEGEQQRDTGRTGSDRDRAMKTFFMLRPLISQVHAYTVYVDI